MNYPSRRPGRAVVQLPLTCSRCDNVFVLLFRAVVLEQSTSTNIRDTFSTSNSMTEPTTSQASLRVERAVCARCGCMCDDIGLRYEQDRVLRIDRACELGREWLQRTRSLVPKARLLGQPTTIANAIDRAAQLLAAANAPAMVGLRDLSVEALRAAVDLARSAKTTLTPLPSSTLVQERLGLDAPEFAASLGAVRATADLVVFWRADPVATHPRHLERYSGEAELLSGGKRQVWLVDDAENVPKNRTVEKSSQIISLPTAGKHTLVPHTDVEFILRTHELLTKRSLNDSVENDPAAMLASAMLRAKHTHVFLGREAGDDLSLMSAWNFLAAKLRDRLHVTISPLTTGGNERGVVETLTWLTGVPGPMAYDSSFTQLGETSGDWLPSVLTPELLQQPNACDVLLVIGADALERPASKLFASKLFASKIPRIVIASQPDLTAAVSIVLPLLDPRLNATIVRSDGIFLTLCGDGQQGVSDPAVEILRAIGERVIQHERAAGGAK